MARDREPLVSHDLLLVIHAAATWYMVGLIWKVQVVQYPLFAAVGAERFPAYEAAHQRRTTWVVLPPMSVELASAVAIAVVTPGWAAWSGLALVAAVWGSTFAVQVPLHGRLARGFDAVAHRHLVVSNWFRTAAWSARGGLAVWMLLAA